MPLISSPRRIPPVAACLPALLLLLASGLSALTPLALGPARKPPVLDGKLDPEEWADALKLANFKTFQPDFDKDPSQKTEGYFLYDADNLYFAFRCYDAEPAKIKASLSKRDAMFSDDFVGIVFDTYNTMQSGYAFLVNPLGIQGDGMMDIQGNVSDAQDFVWYCKGAIDEQGYVVEARVPLRSIRYPAGKTISIRMAFFRQFVRTSEVASAPPIYPDKGSILAQTQVVSVTGLGFKRVVELLPAATYSSRQSAADGRMRRDESLGELGLTGKVGLSNDLTLDAAINPDFSQVESDAGQVDINLRYALYYPEKRPFFLEGSEAFNLGAVVTSPLQAIVHTRTIVDPKAGFKLTGKVGRNDTIASIFAIDASPSSSSGNADAPDAYFSILRYRRATSQDGYLGLFYTERDQDGRINRVAGPDGQIRLSQASMLSFHALGSFTRAEDAAAWSKGRAISLEYAYDSSKLAVDASFHDISSGFEADTGYLTRAGLTSLVANISPKFYTKSPWFRRISPVAGFSVLRDQDSGLNETSASLGLSAVLKGNSILTALYSEASEIFLGRRFDVSGFTLTARSQLTKKIRLQANFRTGQAIRYVADPYQGYSSRAVLSGVYQPTENINLTLSWSYSDLYKSSTKEKVYDYSILRGRLTYQVNKYLFFRAIVESNSYRRTLLTDFLASFTYIPGTVIHVGYGSFYERLSWVEGEYREADRFLEMKRGFFFKASYLWRL